MIPYVYRLLVMSTAAVFFGTTVSVERTTNRKKCSNVEKKRHEELAPRCVSGCETAPCSQTMDCRCVEIIYRVEPSFSCPRIRGGRFAE